MSDQPSDNAAIVGAAPPPPGIFPSFDHPEYSGQPVVVANIACLALATSVCALRLFTKLKIVRTVDYSDYLIAPAWISAAAFASVNIIPVLVAIFQCHPVEMAWDITISDGSCIDRMAYFIAILALNVTTDLFMLVLPIPMLWKVKMPKRQKLGLIGIFMTGSFVCVVGFLRIKSLVSLMGLNDLTWHLVDGYVWVVIEMNTGIICACLPFMKPFLKQVFPRVFGSSLGSSYRQSSTGQSRAVTLQGHVMELDNKITKTKSCTENLPTGGQGADLRSESQERIFNRPQDCDSVTTDASLPGPTGGSQDVVGQPRDLESAMD
ncbi:Satratoxin biosynthesis SC1 cluster protein 4 [Fusarium oxysporum f. sp. raphani]|uniref:Satratoxin biosynthesis SC1 cluster protein 4 n=1 Tax=Fusarium oxysporum f. sp. raphani TaxID=96318 RepID=A0A8J5PGT2_FUSOX|nr:Satratoxin biosynthesis SC1 cluster protein 4 [Fusarium oxysporum f. sp. raphani]